MKTIAQRTSLSATAHVWTPLRRWLVLLAVGLLAGNSSAWGATRTWTGAAYPDANWSNAGNWDGGLTTPADNDALVFAAGPSSKAPVNDIAGATLSIIASVTISDSGYDITSTSGSTLDISGGFQNTSSSGVSNWRIKLRLTAPQTFSTTTLSASTAFFGTWNLQSYLLTISGSGNMDNTAVISGTGGISKSGSGTLSLANLGNNTYTGKTTVTGGTLFIIQESNLGGNPTSFAADQFQLNGGTLQVGLDCTIDDLNRGITLAASGGIIYVDDTKTLTITRTTGTGPVIAGAGNLTKTGPGAVKLTGVVNTFTGKTIVSEGILMIGANENRLGSTTGASLIADLLTIQNGATLNIYANVNITSTRRGITLGTGGGVISVDESVVLDIARPITGAGSLTKAGLGTLKLSTYAGNNTYAGKTTVSAGILQIDKDSRLGTTPVSYAADQLTIDDTATLNAYNNVSIGSTRGITLSGGTATVAVDNGVTADVGSVVTGAGGLAKTGDGALKLSVVNTYAGKTTVSAGTLSIDAEDRLGNDPASPTADQLTLDGGTLTATADFTIDDVNRGVTLGPSGGTISVEDTFTLAVANVIDEASGGYMLTKSGLGTLKLSTANTYTGKTVVSGGTLSIDAENRLGGNPGSPTTDQLTLDGGTLNASANFTIDDSNRGVTLGAGGGTVSVDDGITLTIANEVGDASGGNALTKVGLGTLTLATTAATYGGATTVSQGKLVVNSGTASGSAVSVASGATLAGTGNAAGTVTVNGNVAPGASPGTLSSGAENWNSGGTYDVEINDAEGTAGVDPGWDKLAISGALTVNATTGSKFTIKLISLSGSSPGTCAHWDSNQYYSWLIAAASSVSGFSADKINLDATGFQNSLGTLGVFSVVQVGNDIYLRFTPVFANPAPYGRAWGTYQRLSVSSLLSSYTTGNDGTARELVAVRTGSAGTVPTVSGGLILIPAPGNTMTAETFQYEVQLTGYATSLATNLITLSVTNGVSAVNAISSTGQGITITFAGVPGFLYVVERSASADFSTTITTVQTMTAPASGLWTYTEASPFNPSYYRSRQNN